MYGSRCSARPRALYTLSTALLIKSISIHHSQSSQSISIYDREIGAKISVSVSISRFLRHENLLYRKVDSQETLRRTQDTLLT